MCLLYLPLTHVRGRHWRILFWMFLVALVIVKRNRRNANLPDSTEAVMISTPLLPYPTSPRPLNRYSFICAGALLSRTAWRHSAVAPYSDHFPLFGPTSFFDGPFFRCFVAMFKMGRSMLYRGPFFPDVLAYGLDILNRRVAFGLTLYRLFKCDANLTFSRKSLFCLTSFARYDHPHVV